MPIYEYQCQECGYEFEKIQKISDARLTKCPKCEQDTLKKLMSATGFRLKGGGWYESDFKSGSKKNIAEKDLPPAPACSTGGCKSCPID